MKEIEENLHLELRRRRLLLLPCDLVSLSLSLSPALCMYICMYVYLYMYMYICKYLYIYTCICISVYISVYVYVYVYIIHICIFYFERRNSPQLNRPRRLGRRPVPRGRSRRLHICRSQMSDRLLCHPQVCRSDDSWGLGISRDRDWEGNHVRGGVGTDIALAWMDGSDSISSPTNESVGDAVDHQKV